MNWILDGGIITSPGGEKKLLRHSLSRVCMLILNIMLRIEEVKIQFYANN